MENIINDEKIYKDMETSGVKKNPLTNEYSNAQKDNFLLNKKTDNQVKENKEAGVKQSKLADAMAESGVPAQKVQDAVDTKPEVAKKLAKSDVTAEDVTEATKPEPEAPELTEEESLEAKNEIESAVVEGNRTPQAILQSISDKYGFGLLAFNEDGTIKIPDIKEESQWKRADTAGKLAMIGTVLSCIVTAVTGGNIPPINFNKIVGLDKQYTAYLANVHQFNNAIAGGLEKASKNVADIDYANYMAAIPENERRLVQDISSDFEYTKAACEKEKIETQGKVSKELQEAMILASVTYLKALQKAYDEGSIKKETFQIEIEKARAANGEWSGPFERYATKAGIRFDFGAVKGEVGNVK